MESTAWDARFLNDTPISLLERLRLGPDPASWERLVALYTPLIRSWLGRSGVQPADTDDLVQEVLGMLLRELPQFRHDLRSGAFRRWLRAVVLNRLRTFWRARNSLPQTVGHSDLEGVLERLADPQSDLSRLWDEEYDRHVVRRLFELIEPEFEPPTWQAFRLLVLEGLPTRDVARRLGLSANAVRIAKHRVLVRFRQEIEGLLD
jgi:RNA polymerase sigma-70 factor (ECF subfamily)